mgnify:CR=1 FL=1
MLPNTVEVTAKNPLVSLRRWSKPCALFNATECPLDRGCTLSSQNKCGSAVHDDWLFDDRLNWVRMQYRLKGSAGPDSWRDALANEGGILELRDRETQYGGAVGRWLVPSTDGEYEIRLKAQCEFALGAEFDQSTTSAITGVIDRSPPRPFSRFHEPADGVYAPGDTIAVAWYEDESRGTERERERER